MHGCMYMCTYMCTYMCMYMCMYNRNIYYVYSVHTIKCDIRLAQCLLLQMQTHLHMEGIARIESGMDKKSGALPMQWEPATSHSIERQVSNGGATVHDLHSHFCCNVNEEETTMNRLVFSNPDRTQT